MKEYTAIQMIKKAIDPIVTAHMIQVQLGVKVSAMPGEERHATHYEVFNPTKMFAQKIAATDAVVPKSVSESMVFPVHDVVVPFCQTM